MPATYTLATTTLAKELGATDVVVKLASTSGVLPGMRLFVEGELLAVVSLGVAPWVNVRRGVDETRARAHDLGATVYLGTPDQFFNHDPKGRPSDVILVSPMINVSNGNVWFALGDAAPGGQRWWALQTVTTAAGPLGVWTTTTYPTAST